MQENKTVVKKVIVKEHCYHHYYTCVCIVYLSRLYAQHGA